MGVKESVIEVIKDLVLPELSALKGAVGALTLRLELAEKKIDILTDRLVGIDSHLIDQSRRIDEQRQELLARIDQQSTRIDQQSTRIDELRAEITARIDQQTARIDQQGLRLDSLTDRVGALAEEVAAFRHQNDVIADVLRRLAKLEDRVAA
jgi:chromosome segregation ATPase